MNINNFDHFDKRIKTIEYKHFGLDKDYLEWLKADRPPLQNIEDLINYFDDILQAFKIATHTPHSLDSTCWCQKCKLTNFNDRVPWEKN